MRIIDQEVFNEILKHADIKARIKTELKFIKSTVNTSGKWNNYELVAVSDRTADKGILLLQPKEDLYIVEYELSRKIIDSKSGRRRAIICDFCYTWQPGSNAASITLYMSKTTKRNVRFLCCGDLNCSQHVRSLTKASVLSRSQLRENITNDDRVQRLKERLTDKISQLELIKVSDFS